eukprot:264014-Rhodomonas_salina.2
MTRGEGRVQVYAHPRSGFFVEQGARDINGDVAAGPHDVGQDPERRLSSERGCVEGGRAVRLRREGGVGEKEGCGEEESGRGR